MNVAKVLIVDDDPLVRTGLQFLLRSMPEIRVIGEATDGSEVLNFLDREVVDVVLSDVRMRRVSGTSILGAVREKHPRVRVVLMSSAFGEDFADHAANAGAHAFVPKTASPDDFRIAISGSRRPEATVQTDGLSQREKAVASRVAAGASNLDISQELSLSINTVKTYVSRVMSKVGADNRVQLANLINRANGR